MVRRLPTEAVIVTSARRSLHTPRVEAADDVPAGSLEAIDAAAYKEGYAEGFAEGARDGLRDIERRMHEQEERMRRQWQDAEAMLSAERERLSSLVDSLSGAMERHATSMEELAFEIALASLQQMFGSMPGDRELLRRLCAQMVDELRGKALRIGVTSADRAFLPEQIAGVDIHTEADLAAGECRLSTAHGERESSIAIRLEAIYRSMLETSVVDRT